MGKGRATAVKRSARAEFGLDDGGFIKSIDLRREEIESFDEYPYSIPAVRGLNELKLHPAVTFFVGENGSGKSTVIEAIAVVAGFNAEGGSKNFRFATRRSESNLSDVLRIARGVRRERDGYFLRAESLFNVATEIEELRKHDQSEDLFTAYGGMSLHEQSHGESFIALVANRFRGNGLYILDEPEAALSPRRQLALLKLIDMHVRQRGSQFVIATHSPILMAYPNALIYNLSGDGIAPIAYGDTEHYQITSRFLAAPEAFFRHLFTETGSA